MEITLKVAESSIRAGGIAKVSEEVLKKLKIGEGGRAVVTFVTGRGPKRQVGVSLYIDEIYSKNTIRLRQDDADRLVVSDGMEVIVVPDTPTKKQEKEKGETKSESKRPTKSKKGKKRK